MDANKTYVLRLKPIGEITEDEMSNELLAYNGKEYMNGDIRLSQDCKRYVCYRKGTLITEITHYAVLPKDK